MLLHDLMPFTHFPYQLSWTEQTVIELVFVNIMKRILRGEGTMVKFVAAKHSDESDCIVMGRFPKVTVLSDSVEPIAEIPLVRPVAITTFVWGQLGCCSFIKLFKSAIGTFGNQMWIKLAFVEPMTVSQEVGQADILIPGQGITHED